MELTPDIRRKVAELVVWGHDGQEMFSKEVIVRRIAELLRRISEREAEPIKVDLGTSIRSPRVFKKSAASAAGVANKGWFRKGGRNPHSRPPVFKETHGD